MTRGTDRCRDNERGFAMMALMVVMVLAFAAIGGSFLVIGSKQEQELVVNTRFDLTRLGRDIEAWVAANQASTGNYTFPCPDDPSDGVDGRPPGGDLDCAGDPASARFGVIPWLTFGLSREQVIDASGNYISYAVGQATPSGLTISVRNAGGVAPRSTDCRFVLISHGANHLGAVLSSGNSFASAPDPASDEAANTGIGATFFSSSPEAGFDDQVWCGFNGVPLSHLMDSGETHG